MEKEKNPILGPEKMALILDEVYGTLLKGISKVAQSVDQLADD